MDLGHLKAMVEKEIENPITTKGSKKAQIREILRLSSPPS